MKQSTLGSYIRFLRIRNSMTQAQLAEKLNVTDKAVSKWERDISYPDIAMFPKLANALGVNVSDLLNENSDDDRSSRLTQIFDMSQDIRTPLHIIIGCAETAKNHIDDPELLIKYLGSIRVSGEYLLGVLDKAMQNEAGNPDEMREIGRPSVAELLERSLSLVDPSAGDGADSVEQYDFTGKRIMIAEDMEINREIVAELLKQTGAECEFAKDGKNCLEMMENAPAGYYDLILMDVLMPKMDGIEATRKIRSLPDSQKAQIPIIAVTANVSEKDRALALQAGMDAFTEKPINRDRLFEIMSRYL